MEGNTTNCMADVPSYEVTNQHGWSRVLHQNWLLLIASEVGIPLCMGNHHTRDRCTSPTPHKTTSLGGEEMMPQEQNGKVGHPMTYQKSFPGVEIQEVAAWIVDVYWSIH